MEDGNAYHGDKTSAYNLAKGPVQTLLSSKPWLSVSGHEQPCVAAAGGTVAMHRATSQDSKEEI